MGQSTNAILFYGYCLGEDVDVEDWEEKYAKVAGIKEPTVEYPTREVKRTKENGYNSTPTDYSAEEQAAIEEHRAFWQKKRELIAAGGVEIDSHCSCEYPMHFVHIAKAEKKARRGDEEEIKPEDLVPQPGWADSLKEFCKIMDLKIEGEPKWFLVSMWC